MIGSFPSPYPDELFYSVCARFGDIMQYPTKEAVNTELFGRRGTAAIVDLPSNLGHFTSVLPPNDYYSVERIVNKHSLLPFYSPFLPHDRAERLRYNMRNSGGGSVHNISGVTATTVRTPGILRYCPLCAKAEKEEFGESYWHRLHQLPGVEVCPTHHVILEDSSALIRHRLAVALYISAEQAIEPKPPRSIELSNSLHSGWLNLAKNISWLLDQWNLTPGFNALRSAYLKLLTDQDLTYRGWKVRALDLVRLFKGTYDITLLKTLQCNFEENKQHNWLSCLVKNLAVGKVVHPLRHLLLIQLLGHTSESFFTICAEHKPVSSQPSTKPFRCGPYPCLNPVCRHFRQRVISDKVVKYRGRTRPPSGIFGCTCGYSYMRKGSDMSRDDLYRRDQVIVYGGIWEAALRNMWNDTSLSIRTISKRLGVPHSTAKYQAVALGLQFPRKGTNKVANVETDYQQRLRSNRSKRLELSSQVTQGKVLHCYRKKWRSTLLQHPDANRTRLQRAAPSVYSWLKSQDRDWLEANMPPRWRRTESARQVDWISRDWQVAKEVRLVADQIKKTDGCPIRILTGTIARHLHQKNLITRAASLRKLPLTAQTLREVTESRVEFSLRRIRWAITQLRNERVGASFSTIGLRARLDWNMWYVPEVKAVMEEGVVFLGKFGG